MLPFVVFLSSNDQVLYYWTGDLDSSTTADGKYLASIGVAKVLKSSSFALQKISMGMKRQVKRVEDS